MVIRIQVDTVKKWRNKNEYRPVHRATYKNFSVSGDRPVIRDLCRVLAANNYKISRIVEVYRRDMPCFTPTPLKQWVKRNPFAGEQPVSLRKKVT
jgi:hypothetical protein